MCSSLAHPKCIMGKLKIHVRPKRDENRMRRPSNEHATGSEHNNDKLHDQDELLHNFPDS